MTTRHPNQLFSFSRWRLYVGKHWVEHGRRYWLSLFAIGGLIAVWDAFLIAMDRYAPLVAFMQVGTYFTGLYFAGCLYSSMLFAELSTKKEALPWLSLPASQFEKLLCALLFGTLLFFVAYTLVFYLVDIPMVHWANAILEKHPLNWPNTNQRVPPSTVYNIFTAAAAPIPERDYHFLMSSYFATQAAFLLGSVYFSRYAFIKTVVAVVLFVLGYLVFQHVVVAPLLPRGWYNDMMRWTQMIYDMEPPQNEVRLPPTFELLLMRVLQFGLPPFFWFTTYVRLKEKEV